MRQKLIISVFCCMCAGALSIAPAAVADTIKGLVSDSVSGNPIESLTVASEGVSTLTNSIGAFTLAYPATLVARFESPQYLPALTWRPENGSFSWNGYSGDLSIKVHTTQGNVVAGHVSGKNSTGSRFSIANLPQGIYIVAIEAQGRTAVYEIRYLKINQANSFTIKSATSGIGPLFKALATSKSHDLLFTKKGDTLGKMTVPAGTTARLEIKLKLKSAIGKYVRVFDGKTFDGWAQHPGGSWKINAEDSSMQIVGGRSHVYTTKAYVHYRVTFQVKTTSDGTHHPCTLFLGQDTSADACGAIQFQLPYWGGWDYRAGHGGALGGQHWDNPPFDITKWVECEAVVNMPAGTVVAGSAYPPGSKGKVVQLFTDTSIKDYKPAPFAFQCHGDNGLTDEYKDVFIEENPTSDTLLITQRP